MLYPYTINIKSDIICNVTMIDVVQFLNLKTMEENNMKNKIRKVVENIILFVSVIAFTIGYIGLVVDMRHRRSQATEENLVKEIRIKKDNAKREADETKFDETQEVEDIEEESERAMLPEYQVLYEENNDLFGWIRIEGTKIDYPVMHTPENPNFYLHRSWEREESIQGTIYIDDRTTEDTENIIIYGHHMRDGSMFGSLKKYYSEPGYYEEHKYIQFDTLYEHATYEIIAVSKAIVYYPEGPKPPEGEYLYYEHVELDSEEEFDAYINAIKQNAYFETGVTAQYGDQLITLSTCDYWTENARLIVVARKM